MAFSKTDQLVAYLAKEHRDTTVTVLMKLAYLVDLTSVQARNKKVSRFKYIRYNYGPFDVKIYEVISKLRGSKVLSQESSYGPGNSEFFVYRFNENAGKSFKFEKLKDDRAHINKVLNTLKGLGAKTLTTIAYQTKPMRALNATLGGTENMMKPLNLKAR